MSLFEGMPPELAAASDQMAADCKYRINSTIMALATQQEQGISISAMEIGAFLVSQAQDSDNPETVEDTMIFNTYLLGAALEEMVKLEVEARKFSQWLVENPEQDKLVRDIGAESGAMSPLMDLDFKPEGDLGSP